MLISLSLPCLDITMTDCTLAVVPLHFGTAITMQLYTCVSHVVSFTHMYARFLNFPVQENLVYFSEL